MTHAHYKALKAQEAGVSTPSEMSDQVRPKVGV